MPLLEHPFPSRGGSAGSHPRRTVEAFRFDRRLVSRQDRATTGGPAFRWRSPRGFRRPTSPRRRGGAIRNPPGPVDPNEGTQWTGKGSLGGGRDERGRIGKPRLDGSSTGTRIRGENPR